MFAFTRSEIVDSLNKSIFVSIKLLYKMHKIKIELARRARLAEMLLLVGLDKKDKIINEILKDVYKSQQRDGGWESVGETLYCLQFLSHFDSNKNKLIIKNALSWLYSIQNTNGGFGRSNRDRSRIPVSYLVLETLRILNVNYNNVVKKTIDWIEKEWTKDMKVGGLSYKCSGVLIANNTYPKFSVPFIQKSINWLLNLQNDDDGWSSFKKAPVGSVPSYTALAIRSLIYYLKENKNLKIPIERGIKWLLLNQLSSGLWSEHHLDNALCPSIKCLNLIIRYLNNKK